MKTLWSSKYLNRFNLSLASILVGKPWVLLPNVNGCPRFLFKVRTFAVASKYSRWRLPFQNPTTLEWSKFCVTARKFHGSNTLVVNQKQKKKAETLQELVEATEKPQTAVTVGQKVAQAGKDVSYFAIMLAGFAVTGALLWYVLSELFLSSSPNKIYADALKKVKRNEEVIEAIGQSIKAYGEETSRGRRRHVSFQEYIVAGENYMRVKFYVAGNHRKGTVHVDVKQVGSRKFEYRFIFVELDGFPPRTIIIEDNR